MTKGLGLASAKSLYMWTTYALIENFYQKNALNYFGCKTLFYKSCFMGASCAVINGPVFACLHALQLNQQMAHHTPNQRTLFQNIQHLYEQGGYRYFARLGALNCVSAMMAVMLTEASRNFF